MAIVQKPKSIQNFLVGLGVILLVIAGIAYLRTEKIGEKPSSTFEEVLVQGEGVVKKTGEGVEAMTEEEIEQMKEEVDGVLSVGGEQVRLVDVGGGGARGEGKKAFSDGKFYFKLEATGLRLMEKGYYYEGWLKKGDDYLSVGRMELNLEGKGALYYTVSVDRSDYNEVMLTYEPEDGNEAPARAVLVGGF
jgi:hypothetical protein